LSFAEPKTNDILQQFSADQLSVVQVLRTREVLGTTTGFCRKTLKLQLFWNLAVGPD
jgi:hypothetical protein